MLKKYKKRPESSVVAVQLQLETEGFSYQKWGGTQTCKAGDWLLNNNGNFYTVTGDSFAKTYRELSPGVFLKVGIVLAEIALETGKITTKEGVTHYQKGDYIVYNDKEKKDGYAISRQEFERMYEPTDAGQDSVTDNGDLV